MRTVLALLVLGYAFGSLVMYRGDLAVALVVFGAVIWSIYWLVEGRHER